MDVQTSSPTTSKDSEFVRPEVPCSNLFGETITTRQGEKRQNSADESNGDYESVSEAASGMSTQSKKRKSVQKTQTKPPTASQRNNAFEAQNSKLSAELKEANNEIADLKRRVSEIELKLSELLEKQNSHSSLGVNHNQASIDFWNKLPKQTTHEITKAVRQETALLDKKEKNVIVFGIPENYEGDDNEKIQADKKSIEKIFDALNIKSAVGEYKFKRIKTKNQSPNSTGPVIIEFESSIQKFKVLKASKQLNRTGDHKNIFINPDRTIAELEVEKKLRAERNHKNSELEHTNANGLKFGKFSFSEGKEPEDFYWGIRNAKLQRVKIKSNNSDC